MGECADMVLDGYLDQDGSYSGTNNFTKKYPVDVQKSRNRTMNLLRSFGIKHLKRKPVLVQYAIHKQWVTRNFTKICLRIANDETKWKEFRSWLKDRNNQSILTKEQKLILEQHG